MAPRHLKSRLSQRVGSHSNQKLLHTISIQKISSIHKFTLKVKHVLGSHELKSHGHFWIRPHKNNWIKFSLSQIRISIKKWLYPICSFLSLVTRLAALIFEHGHPKMFWSAINFYNHVSTCKKSVDIFHLFIFQVLSILESHHLTGDTHFWPSSR